MGEMYKEEWVQNLVRQIQDYIVLNSGWLGIDKSSSKYILDYACGDGTVSKAIMIACPNAVCRGVDNVPAQVDRYNDEARQVLGDSADRMYAIIGDLTSPSPGLEQSEWFGFDLAFISAALHHVKDPVDMLTRLYKRLKKGGALVVVEWLRPDALRAGSGHSASSDGGDHSSSTKYDPAKMVEVIGGQRIWPGFTLQSLEAAMLAAGFADVEMRVHSETIWLPGLNGGGNGDNRIILVKGTTG